MARKQKLMFYCQHILGIGHLVRSLEIVRGLLNDFEVCFINGGEAVPAIEIPAGVHVINLPAIKTDAEFQELQAVDGSDLGLIEEKRSRILGFTFDLFRPDILMIELFPFGRRRFSFELIPLIEQAQQASTQIVCSLRDIVVTKTDQARHEEKVCRLINKYFDLVLVHGDPQFQPLEESFSRVQDLRCPVLYTGYVVQPVVPLAEEACPDDDRPTIVASIGGGRFGHELLEGLVRCAPLLAERIPHRLQVFMGPLCPDEVVEQLLKMAAGQPNLTLERFTPNLPGWMLRADLSISMSGYNTTMNVLSTGVRALMLAFTGNDDQEQRLRSEKLEQMGIISRLCAEDLVPERLAERVIACLNQDPLLIRLDAAGVARTADLLRQLRQPSALAVA